MFGVEYITMRRRKFITVFGGGLAAWSLAGAARAQPPPVIGYLSGGAPEPSPQLLAAFHRGLGDAGYVEGRNVAIEYRWAEGRYDRLPALAADLVRRKVALVVATGGTVSALAARAETATRLSHPRRNREPTRSSSAPMHSSRAGVCNS